MKMKGLSVIVALGLLVMAQILARHLRAAGAFPLEVPPHSNMTHGAEEVSTSPGVAFQL
jgi:hypothetical protein